LGVQKTKSISIIFIGDFPEGDQKNARLKCIGNRFVENGWEVEFVSMYPTSFSKNRDGGQSNQWNGIPVRHILNWDDYPSLFAIRILQLFATHLFFLFYILRISLSKQVLYFYTPQWIGTLPGLLLAKLCRNKIIVDQTDLHSTTQYRWLHRIEEYLVAKATDALVVISPYLLNHFTSLKKSNLYLVPIMVDMKRFESKVMLQAKLLGYIGSFSEKDGISDILKGFKASLVHYPELKLRMIGRDYFQSNTLKLLRELGIEGKVELTGRVNYDSIPKRLLECDTLIMNRDLSAFSETGYPIKLGEYFATNRPVLMSDGSGYQTLFDDKDTVIKYESGSALSFVDAVTYRYTNTKKAEDISNNGYKFAFEYFKGNKVAQKIVDIATKL